MSDFPCCDAGEHAAPAPDLRDTLIAWAGKQLGDVETGPLSDTPYRDAELDDEGTLALYLAELVDGGFGLPAASVDVPQLVDALMQDFTITPKGTES